MKIKTHIPALALIVCLLTPGITALAQSNTATTPSTEVLPVSGDWYLNSSPESVPGTVSCFDYYTFGSVQVDVSPTLVTDIIPGSEITFAGSIKNANPYPVVDGQVYVKIFKLGQTSDDDTRLNGYPIVDFFLAKDSIALDAGEQQDISFNWPVPSGMSGEYQAAFFFTTAKRYNLLGLSFTDDVTGNKANFSVTNLPTATAPVMFDKNSITLNNSPYHPTTPFPHFAKDEAMQASVSVVNPTAIAKTVSITWTTSQWDGILPEHERKAESVEVTLAPNETKEISYPIPNINTSVTFLQGVLTDGHAKSLLNIRFIHDDIAETRINFPSILSYPLVAGQENTVFSCLHSTNLPLIDNSSLTLTLKDAAGVVLHTYTYTGGVTSAMMGVKDTFTPSQSLTEFSLTARLETAGTLVDEVTMQYSCDQIDNPACPKPEVAVTTEKSGIDLTTIIFYLMVAVGLLLLVSLIFYLRNKPRAETISNDN